MQEKQKETMSSSLWDETIEFIDMLLMIVGGITFFVMLSMLLFFTIVILVRAIDISYIISFINYTFADILSQYKMSIAALVICTVYFVIRVIRLEIAY